MTDEPAGIDLSFAPEGYASDEGDDPLQELLGILESESERRLAKEFLVSGQTDQLERLLVQRGILLPVGALNPDHAAVSDRFAERRVDEIRSERISIAVETACSSYSNSVSAQRVGWTWVFTAHLDGANDVIARNVVPLTLGELIDGIDATGLGELLHAQEESMVWESDFYPGLAAWYQSLDLEWRHALDEDEEEEGRE